MKKIQMLLVLLVALASAAVTARAAGDAASQFDKLKTLAGEWQGKATDGTDVHVTYKLVSGGSALMETIQPTGEGQMVTLYHRDGDRLMLTHYCMANNQPRMRADASSNVNAISFSFVDATNLSSADAGHMHAHSIAWKDADHVTQQWTWRQGGKEQVEKFELQRQ